MFWVLSHSRCLSLYSSLPHPTQTAHPCYMLVTTCVLTVLTHVCQCCCCFSGWSSLQSVSNLKVRTALVFGYPGPHQNRKTSLLTPSGFSPFPVLPLRLPWNPQPVQLCALTAPPFPVDGQFGHPGLCLAFTEHFRLVVLPG